MNLSNCLQCGESYVKKRTTHKFCRTACRVRYNRKKNGVSEPSFLTPTVQGSPIRSKPKILKSHKIKRETSNLIYEMKTADNTAFSTTSKERTLLLSFRQYWSDIYNQAGQGVTPLFTTIGAGVGYNMGSDDKGKRRRKKGGGSSAFFAAVLGGIVGYQIDKSIQGSSQKKKEKTQQNALKQIALIDKELRKLDNVNKQIGDLQRREILTPTDVTDIVKIVGSEQYKNSDISTLKMTGKYLYLFGDPAPGFLMLVSGRPGNGKTTFTVEFTEHFQRNHGKAIYLPFEQKGMNKPFQELLNQYDTSFDINIKPTNNIEELSKDLKGYHLAIIDSINHAGINAEELEKLRIENPKLSIVCIMQSTKSGDFKGDQRFLHDCDIHVSMENGIANQSKSRFAKAKASVDIWK